MGLIKFVIRLLIGIPILLIITGVPIILAWSWNDTKEVKRLCGAWPPLLIGVRNDQAN